MSLSTTIAGPFALARSVRAEHQCLKLRKNVPSNPLGLKPLRVHLQPLERRSINRASRNVRCAAAEQTQTVTRQSSTITVAPIQGKEKSPDLDDGGAGLPPRDDGDGGGGGGGGGGWAGGFFFFGFLALLGLFKDQENDGSYRPNRRR